MRVITLISVCLGAVLINAALLRAEDKKLIIAQSVFGTSVMADYYSGVRLDSNKFHEANPVMGNSKYSQAVIMAGTSGATFYCTKRLYERNKVLGLMVLGAVTGAHVYAAQHNWRLK